MRHSNNIETELGTEPETSKNQQLKKINIQKRNRKKAVVISLSTLVALSAMLLGIFTVSAFKNTETTYPPLEPVDLVSDTNITQVTSTTPTPVGVEEVEPTPAVDDSERLNILVLGVDARAENLTGRSDAILVVSMDKKTDSIDMLSIPRDSYVELIGRGTYDKINHAFSFGGSGMTIATVENLLEIDIDHYVVINFTSFIEVVDALGGIEVEVPFNFTEQDSQGVHNRLYFYEGLQTLNGEEALAYSRMRKKDPKGDVGRGERQQEVIKATIEKVKEIDSIPTYIKVFNAVRRNIETDVGVFDIHKLAPYVETIGSVETHTLKGDGMSKRGVYYYQLEEESLESIKSTLKE